MVLGRLAIHLEAEDLLLFSPRIITKVFVVSFMHTCGLSIALNSCLLQRKGVGHK